VGIRSWSLGSGTSAALGALLVAGLMVLVVPSGLASAAVPASSGDGTTWAYGNVVTVDFHGVSAGGAPYTGNATYGYSALIHQINLSGTDFELTVDRTMGASFQVEYCSPTCASHRYYAALADRLWETDNATANLTTAGTVYEGGSAVPAFALLGSSSLQTANFTESTSSYLPASLNVGVARSAYLGAQVDATTSVTFGTPLGLFPTDLTSAQEWNSTASFKAGANASYAYFHSHAAPLANWNVSGHGYFPVERSGNVSVLGSYSPSNSIALGGVTYPEIGLVIQGPFAVREGFILVPSASDLFVGSSAQPWSANDSGQATAGMGFLDVRPQVGGHFGLGASEWVYDSQSLEPTSVAPASSGFTELATGATPDTAPQTVVQGEPQSASQSEATQLCLITGTGCPSGSSTPGFLHGLLGLIGVGAIAVLALAVIAVVVERRRLPPPSYPNSSLYPPGSSSRPLAGRAPTTPESPPPEDDPLGNLW